MQRLPLPRQATGALTLALMLLACESGPITSSAALPASPGAPESSAEPVRFSRYPNPVYPGDFADPFVLRLDSVFYAYATNRGSSNVPTLRSLDLVSWLPVGDAMPRLPDWAASGRSLTWAPAVVELDGRFVLFYTARDRKSDRQCIGRAESASPSGPFVDGRSSPFVCQTDLGGSIDASVVRDSAGEPYLLWKNDGNCCAKPVTLWSQRLSRDGTALLGEPAALLNRDLLWEGPLIEAPTMWREAGSWHLLYSANMWNTERYGVGYAVCESPVGPCRKIGQKPVLASDGETAGPGGAEVFSDREGRTWVAYHGWSAPVVGYSRGGVRSLRIDRVDVSEVF